MSVLGPATELTGKIQGEGGLRVEGKIRGDVAVTGPTEIAEGASVQGNVEAETIDVVGSLDGDAVARGPITIRQGAVVRGELKGSQITIEPGSEVAVRLDTDFELDLGAARRRG